MSTLAKIALIFLGITILAPAFMSMADLEFGTSSYWNRHGVSLLIFLTILPRLTLLLSSIASGGVLWWLGWLFAPRVLVAILATVGYWQTNPILVVCAWLMAWGGEATEKFVVARRVTVYYPDHDDRPPMKRVN